MKDTWLKIRRHMYLAVLSAMLMVGCAPGPKVQPPPAPAAVEPPSPASGFVMKSFHRSMIAEMRKSYDRANEIIIGEFTGIHQEEKGGLIYYFSDFTRFDKDALSWDSVKNVIMQVQSDAFEPEIILRSEFKKLIDLDKIGICWDFYEGNRSVFLVEGKMNLIFLEMGFDEAIGKSYRNLLDAYPVTDECRAKELFNMMIQDIDSFDN